MTYARFNFDHPFLSEVETIDVMTLRKMAEQGHCLTSAPVRQI